MRNKVQNAVLSIILLILTLVMLVPVYFIFTDSLMTERELTERFSIALPEDTGYTYTSDQPFYPMPISGEQYAELFTDGQGYFYQFLRSFAVALIITGGQLIISVTVGFFFGRFTFRGRAVLIAAYVVVLFLPYSATLLPNYMIMREFGLLNTQASLILPAIFSPLGVIIMTIFVSSIPQDTFDAALLETKSLWVMLRHIVLPQIQPGIALTVMISFTEAWNMVEQPQAMMENKLLHPLSVSLNSFFASADVSNFAGAFLYMLPPFILLWSYKDVLTEHLLRGDILEVSNVKS